MMGFEVIWRKVLFYGNGLWMYVVVVGWVVVFEIFKVILCCVDLDVYLMFIFLLIYWSICGCLCLWWSLIVILGDL